jgi:osmoprotectant transport system permease protein
MGMGELQLLARVEVPVALAVILAGIRVSAVSVVATAPLGALVGAGTLGSYILQGLALSDEVRVFAAAVLVALLAILTELGFAWLQRHAGSPGLAGSDGGPLEAPSQMPSALGAI